MSAPEPDREITRFVSRSCEGERCVLCQAPAEAKIGEEIAHDDPQPMRHNLTQYVCGKHFDMILRPYLPSVTIDKLRDAAALASRDATIRALREALEETTALIEKAVNHAIDCPADSDTDEEPEGDCDCEAGVVLEKAAAALAASAGEGGK